jgi:hypothetical protein
VDRAWGAPAGIGPDAVRATIRLDLDVTFEICAMDREAGL